MPTPIDQTLFRLTATVAKEGLAFVARAIAEERTIKRYEVWPAITSAPNGVPDFTFVGTDTPPDYRDLFNPIWRALGLGLRDEFDFETERSFHELKEYAGSQPAILRRLRFSDEDKSWFDFSLRRLIESLIDRYIHVFSQTDLDLSKFRDVYLPYEAGLLLDELPVHIFVPILLSSFPRDSRDLTDVISVSRMSEPLQLARAILAHDSHEVNDYLVQQATHSLVLRDYALPNQLGGFLSYGPEVFPLDTIDAFFAALRIVTSVETGYGQLLIVPEGWAHRSTANLPPLEGTTIRRYPPGLRPVSPFYENDFSIVSDSEFESLQELFLGISSILSTLPKGSERLRLAIKRLNGCYLRENEEDAILDATIGMEILLSDGDTQEVTHKLALRLAGLSSLVPKYKGRGATIFRSVKSSVYAYRSAVVHGDVTKARKKREMKTNTGDPIPAVKTAVEYLGMAVQAIASNPEFLDPNRIDEKLLLNVR
jgi:hypothetical protein